jgi:ribosome biogenesis GTPase A
MSNMLYSLSILYKSKLPLLVVFNKADVLDPSFAQKWMQDFDEFDASLALEDNYLSSLSRSMSLVLEEFYQQIQSVGVSATSHKGFDDKLLEKFQMAKKEYFEIWGQSKNGKPKPENIEGKDAEKQEQTLLKENEQKEEGSELDLEALD